MAAPKIGITGKVIKGNFLHLKQMGLANGKFPSVSDQVTPSFHEIKCQSCRRMVVIENNLLTNCVHCGVAMATSSGLMPEAKSEIFKLGQVSIQTKIICYDNEKIEENLGKVTLYVRLQSRDENIHKVSISSNSPPLCRFLKAKPLGEWIAIYIGKVVMDMGRWKFDLEVAVITEQLNHLTAAPLLNSDDTTDVELIGVDGSVRAHGCIMAAASPFLRAAFYGDFAEARDKRLNVPDANVAALKLIKMFAYTGYVDADPAMMVTLLPLASRFLMTSLARACAASLYDLPPDDLIPLLQIDLKPTSNEEDCQPPQPKKPKL